MKYWKLTGEAELRVSIQALRKYEQCDTKCKSNTIL